MSEIERRAYIENVAAQEAAYWYCRKHGIRADDLDIGQILQVAGPIILQTAEAEIERLKRLLAATEAELRYAAGVDEDDPLDKPLGPAPEGSHPFYDGGQ